MWLLLSLIILFIIVIAVMMYLGRPGTSCATETPCPSKPVCSGCAMPRDRCGCPMRRNCQFC